MFVTAGNKAHTNGGGKSGKTVGTRFSYLQDMQDMLTDSSEGSNAGSSSSSDEIESASEGHHSSDGGLNDTDGISQG